MYGRKPDWAKIVQELIDEHGSVGTAHQIGCSFSSLRSWTKLDIIPIPTHRDKIKSLHRALVRKREKQDRVNTDASTTTEA